MQVIEKAMVAMANEMMASHNGAEEDEGSNQCIYMYVSSPLNDC